MSARTPARAAALLEPRSRRVVAALATLALLAFVLLLWVGPLPQDPRYHGLADARVFFGIPNAVNVLTNLPFLAVGIAGLAVSIGTRACGATAAWRAFFAGVALVSLGSAYYHLAPTDATLLWDRLPIALGCMGLLVALLAEHLRPIIERALLAPAIIVGLASVLWWRYTGDLRLYVAVQALPLLAIPLLLAASPGRYSHRRYLLYGFAAYGAAKAAESYDHAVYALTGSLISGHSLKHVLAALGAGCIWLMLQRRRPV